ncbi:MAG TPA: hypothetical protein VKG05_07460 [Steroidobacteraceae bacterium]|nr:hypothetical protein [Steroidobacteraceae bacterium]
MSEDRDGLADWRRGPRRTTAWMFAAKFLALALLSVRFVRAAFA